MLSRYQDVVVGSRSAWKLIYYEWCLLVGALPGALGLFLRKLFWPRMFGSCGRGVAIGARVVVRHPGRIHLGRNVVISEGCILDARNPQRHDPLILGDDVNLSNDVMISCKNGSVRIGERTGVGARTIIHSADDNPVVVGADAAIGPMCYIVGGGNYNIDRLDAPMSMQGVRRTGGVVIEDDVWLGANVTVLDGVRMGKGAVGAAGAVLTKDAPPLAICMGVPARVAAFRQ
ncbi:acyltransferase [Desulfarculus baarsii]|nr:DapH/DapD/GlmU-related protein [Desulfarculus baarsii]